MEYSDNSILNWVANTFDMVVKGTPCVLLSSQIASSISGPLRQTVQLIFDLLSSQVDSAALTMLLFEGISAA
ncbi:MAG: hypothetical protein KatS3mg054_0100 [Chloroflexus sp.]|nr:MAG: hypothetical protein KatS3mg054_0100 [Chloroflexus sp.]